MAVDGKPLVLFPASHGAGVAPEIGADLLPGFERLFLLLFGYRGKRLFDVGIDGRISVGHGDLRCPVAGRVLWVCF